MNYRFTDIHQHLLYGLDDGAKSQQRMYEMLDLAAEEGIARIVATPHMTPGVLEFNSAQFLQALREAREYSQTRGLGIRIDPGCEVLYTDQTCRFLRDGRVPTLAGTDRVLVEFSPNVAFEKLSDALEQICICGYAPVVAHVERYACLVRDFRRTLRLKDELRIFYQMNCATVLERHGFAEKRFVRRMLREEQIDAIATDAHNITTRAAEILAATLALEETCSEDYIERLTNGSVLEEEP